jgi:hypothetical protein
MKRALLFLLASLVAIAIGAASPARADLTTCTSNIIDGSAAYGGVLGPATLAGTIQTGLDELTPFPTCKSISYNAIISYTSRGEHRLRVEAQKGDGITPFVRFSFARVTSDNGAFCVALFSSKGERILDTAPSTASRTVPPVPVADSSPLGFSCGSWVAVTALGSSGGGLSPFAG